MSDTAVATPPRRKRNQPYNRYALHASPERRKLIHQAAKQGHRGAGSLSIAHLRALVASGPPPKIRPKGAMYPDMQRVWEYLQTVDEATCFRIADELGLEYPTVYCALSHLELRELVERDKPDCTRPMKWRRA